MSKLYRTPAEMAGMTIEEFFNKPQEERRKLWDTFYRHVEGRGYSGLLNAFLQDEAEKVNERKVIK